MDRLSHLVERISHQLPGVLRLRWYARQTRLVDIVTCLRASIGCGCMDPRDRIFAVLSFMEPQARSLIPVDYSLEVAPVYASAIAAIKASYRNLYILSFIRSTEVRYYPDPPTYPAVPAMTTAEFNGFLINWDIQMQGTSPELLKHSILSEYRRLGQFQNDTIGPWQADIEVHIVDELSIITSSVGKEVLKRVEICPKLVGFLTPQNPQDMNIFPRLQVRAHFIDTIAQNNLDTDIPWLTTGLCANKAAEHIYDCLPRLPDAGTSAWIPPFFQESQYILPMNGVSTANEPQDSLGQGITGLNTTDITAFVKIASKHGHNQYMFVTENSVGFARRGHEPNDEIWAIDGARSPFILRKCGYKTYRIVSVCYLWAALELDYWIPGTKKGRWRGDRPAPDFEQTHTIEIH
jgi:hypothetical protein